MNRSLALAWSLWIFLFVIGWADAEDAVKEFQAGAATSNITPPLGEMIIGNWQPIPATNVHDELHARCLVLDDGRTQLAIVLCDNVGIPVEVFDLAKSQIQAATKIDPAHVLLASTHTHSATTARGRGKMLRNSQFTDYQKFLASRIADSVRRALANRRPARIAWGSASEPTEVFNRRWFVTNPALATNPFGGVDQVRMNPPRGDVGLDRPAGPTDPEVSFLAVEGTDGVPISLLANYSLHYVGGVRPGDVSADYFGYFARLIENKLNAENQTPPFVGILSNGTSGDVNNIDFTNKNARRYERYAKMQEVAEKVANRVHEAYASLNFHDWVSLDARLTQLRLKVRKPTPEMVEYLGIGKVSQKESEPEAKPRHRREAIYAERITTILESPDEIEVPMQVLRIGELGVAAIPFEVFAEIGLELKQRSPLSDMFTIELANGSFGYLPTPGQHRLGGYETWLGTNFVEMDASTKITEVILNLAHELADSAP